MTPSEHEEVRDEELEKQEDSYKSTGLGSPKDGVDKRGLIVKQEQMMQSQLNAMMGMMRENIPSTVEALIQKNNLGRQTDPEAGMLAHHSLTYTPLNSSLGRVLMYVQDDLSLRWPKKLKTPPEKRS